MPLARITAHNFKSFAELDLELSAFTLLIGPNGAGKSNVLALLRFVRDISRFGLENAISLQGGVQYLRNVELAGAQPLVVSLVVRHPETSERSLPFLPEPPTDTLIGVAARETRYTFTLEFPRARRRYKIADEHLAQSWLLEDFTGRASEPLADNVAFRWHRSGGKDSFELDLPSSLSHLEEHLLARRLWLATDDARGKLLLESPTLFLPEWVPLVTDTGFYDIDPRLAKRAIPFTGKAELEEDGSNLPIVVSNLLRDASNRRQLADLLSDLLPFVDGVSVQKLADTSLLFRLRERYWPDVYMPASLLSDGTLHLTALLVALFFEEKRTVMIEEPERSIHPALIARVMGLLMDASRTRQIIASSQHPEVIRHAPVNDIVLVRRDSQGFSRLERPIDRPKIRTFLQREIGLDELYLQDLLS
jgi:predicted ATPase